MSDQIIGMRQWFETPPGRYLLAWERAEFDRAVSDIFGFHALQLGLPELDTLQANRMPHKWLALREPESIDATSQVRPSIITDFSALPFEENSLDLVVLPHSLELNTDPHATLREVERVLVPEGRVVVVGFNPASLWGLRQRLGRMRRGMALGRQRPLFMPRGGEYIGYWRLRDWLTLLSFEIERGRFGCYRPPLASQRWLARFGWMEPAGDRWWPVFGAVYFLVAVKRVRGMRLIGLAKRERAKNHAAPAVVTHRRRERRRKARPSR
jgi:SAM-dependent methyltransferase